MLVEVDNGESLDPYPGTIDGGEYEVGDTIGENGNGIVKLIMEDPDNEVRGCSFRNTEDEYEWVIFVYRDR